MLHIRPVQSHLLYESAFTRVAKRYNVVIGVRSPNPLNFALLKEGLPSKNFHIKAKSSPTGPTAGFITQDPKYSKTPLSLSQQHAGYITDAQVKGAQAVNLIISNDRQKELINSNDLTSLGDERYSAQYPNGKFYFIIKDTGQVLDENHNPIKVMTNPPEIGQNETNPKPITADYDLFTLIPRENQSNNIRPLTIAPKLLKGKFNLDFLAPKSCCGKNEDVNKGNIHFFAKVIAHRLNHEISNEGYTGGKLIWHNDETGNPFSPGFDQKDQPLFFLPSGEILSVNSKKQLIDFYSSLKSKGYTPEYSPRFGF